MRRRRPDRRPGDHDHFDDDDDVIVCDRPDNGDHDHDHDHDVVDRFDDDHDGTGPGPMGCPASDPAGPGAENTFLRQWIPKILAASAYRKDGVLVIAVAGSGTGTGHPTRTGALVLSRWARRGAHLSAATGPYSLLRLTEDVLGFTPLAHAASAPQIAEKVLGTKR